MTMTPWVSFPFLEASLRSLGLSPYIDLVLLGEKFALFGRGTVLSGTA
jgi:hypothetical protein